MAGPARPDAGRPGPPRVQGSETAPPRRLRAPSDLPRQPATPDAGPPGPIIPSGPSTYHSGITDKPGRDGDNFGACWTENTSHVGRACTDPTTSARGCGAAAGSDPRWGGRVGHPTSGLVACEGTPCQGVGHTAVVTGRAASLGPHRRSLSGTSPYSRDARVVVSNAAAPLAGGITLWWPVRSTSRFRGCRFGTGERAGDAQEAVPDADADVAGGGRGRLHRARGRRRRAAPGGDLAAPER